MATKLEHKILLWASTSDKPLHGLTRKEFNGGIKEAMGEDGYQVALRLWKEGYIVLGRMGLVTISGKGCFKMTEDIEDAE